MSTVPFCEIVEGTVYTLDWYINGIQKHYIVRIAKKNNDRKTLYAEVLSLLPTMAWTVCYQHLIDASSDGDHTWLRSGVGFAHPC